MFIFPRSPWAPLLALVTLALIALLGSLLDARVPL